MPRLVLGLGNPGPQYRETRHNVGFRVVEELARRLERSFEGDAARDECGSRVLSLDDLTLVLPQTFMNRSGYAARCLVEVHGFAPEEILVVYDEVALPLGRLRMRRGGSPAGHRGIESILQQLRTDQIPRLRLGVGRGERPAIAEGAAEEPPPENLADFVLSPFAPEERETVAVMIERAADACAIWVADGVEVAMTRFNG
ncbi:MAG TPA: aminoacyl-tRNA hydrolase [Thermoanaerobaculia bacterium]|jgi:PTH1 family peptidyl-tRNA hydrolase|nr:aminoacyl-tRNA hydrolase [Thermoanaerobaculia bacterium]